MSTAIYAGSFDPVTKGHLYVIKEGLKVFEKVIVLIATNPDKKSFLSIDEKRRFIKNSILEEGLDHKRAYVVNLPEGEFVVDFAKTLDTDVMLRGVRNQTDFEYEKNLQVFNRDINKDITNVYFIPPEELCSVSSSSIKMFLKMPNSLDKMDLSKYLTNNVIEGLRKKI